MERKGKRVASRQMKREGEKRKERGRRGRDCMGERRMERESSQGEGRERPRKTRKERESNQVIFYLSIVLWPVTKRFVISMNER